MLNVVAAIYSDKWGAIIVKLLYKQMQGKKIWNVLINILVENSTVCVIPVELHFSSCFACSSPDSLWVAVSQSVSCPVYLAFDVGDRPHWT